MTSVMQVRQDDKKTQRHGYDDTMRIRRHDDHAPSSDVFYFIKFVTIRGGP